MDSKISHKIKGRNKPNDIFITPLFLAKKAISLIDYKEKDIWYDPFKATGHYYEQFPTVNKEWSEITAGRDFFKFNKPIDIICSNPPYSILDNIIRHSIALNPRVIQYLIGISNLTARRIEMFEEAGYGLTKMHLCKIFKWYGMSVVVQFEKDKPSIFTYDRKVH